MGQTSIPQGYSPLLSIYETQKAIGLLKRLFEDRLSGALRLHRVSAPLFVAASSGLNDDLNGVERPVSFDIRGVNDTAVVVHSLARIWTTSTPPMWTSGTGRRSSPRRTGTQST